ncbi:hypothetical protein HK100_002293 [Physocladia obscura]|uniref:CBS domain-containing protein n=1 Tax=Physocladia obscura TaxID=109957 RepID=A0AAD5T870_9FUNG|nr:hypothetical protein HK100_002293 [Physocladia obscura]
MEMEDVTGLFASQAAEVTEDTSVAEAVHVLLYQRSINDDENVLVVRNGTTITGIITAQSLLEAGHIPHHQNHDDQQEHSAKDELENTVAHLATKTPPVLLGYQTQCMAALAQLVANGAEYGVVLAASAADDDTASDRSAATPEATGSSDAIAAETAVGPIIGVVSVGALVVAGLDENADADLPRLRMLLREVTVTDVTQSQHHLHSGHVPNSPILASQIMTNASPNTTNAMTHVTPAVLPPLQSAKFATHAMLGSRTSALLVADRFSIKGVLTARALLDAHPAASVASLLDSSVSPPASISANATILDALTLIRDTAQPYLAVLDGNIPIGLVDSISLAKSLFETHFNQISSTGDADSEVSQEYSDAASAASESESEYEFFDPQNFSVQSSSVPISGGNYPVSSRLSSQSSTYSFYSAYGNQQSSVGNNTSSSRNSVNSFATAQTSFSPPSVSTSNMRHSLQLQSRTPSSFNHDRGPLIQINEPSFNISSPPPLLVSSSSSSSSLRPKSQISVSLDRNTQFSTSSVSPSPLLQRSLSTSTTSTTATTTTTATITPTATPISSQPASPATTPSSLPNQHQQHRPGSPTGSHNSSIASTIRHSTNRIDGNVSIKLSIITTLSPQQQTSAATTTVHRFAVAKNPDARQFTDALVSSCAARVVSSVLPSLSLLSSSLAVETADGDWILLLPFVSNENTVDAASGGADAGAVAVIAAVEAGDRVNLRAVVVVVDNVAVAATFSTLAARSGSENSSIAMPPLPTATVAVGSVLAGRPDGGSDVDSGTAKVTEVNTVATVDQKDARNSEGSGADDNGFGVMRFLSDSADAVVSGDAVGIFVSVAVVAAAGYAVSRYVRRK